jgi:glycosyltransferase involved in cell wall biosynthesis
MIKVNLVLDDNSGGVFSVSEELFTGLGKCNVNTKIFNFSIFSSHLIKRASSGFFWLLNSDKKDIYILMHFLPIFLGLFLKFIGYKKLINVIHTDLVGYYDSAGLLKRLVIRFIFYFLRDSPIVFVSKESMMRAEIFFKLSSVDYIYNLGKFSNKDACKIKSSDSIRGKSDKIIFGIVSRLHLAKNIDLAIRLVKQVNLIGYNVDLIIYGDGSEKIRLFNYINLLGCTNYIFLAGHCGDKNRIFNSFDALISFTRLEGLPTVILEAFSFCKPVFYTDCHSGPRELMSPNSNPLIKTMSYEKTNSGILVKPILVGNLPSYSKQLADSELIYVNYMSIFLEDLIANKFSILPLNKEFDSNFIIDKWFYVFKKNNFC